MGSLEAPIEPRGIRPRDMNHWRADARLLDGRVAPGHGEKNEKLRYGASGSIWTIWPVCWPSVHMLERTFGSELFCTSIWRVLMDVGRR